MLKMAKICLTVIISLLALVTGAGNSLANPPPSPFQSVTLTPPFTITYTLHTKINDLPPGAPKNISTRPETYIVTLSAKDETLLYQCRHLSTGLIVTQIYQAGKTYITYSDSPAAYTYPGFDFTRMMYAPISGVGIPNVPILNFGMPESTMPSDTKQRIAQMLANEKKVIMPTLLRTPDWKESLGNIELADTVALLSGRSNYPPGFGAAGYTIKSGKIAILWFARLSTPTPTFVWQFPAHTYFQNQWLASTIRASFYLSPKPNSSTLFRTSDYQLKSASTAPLKSAAYNIITYLHETTSINDYTTKKTIAYVYQKGHGTLAQQQALNGVIDKQNQADKADSGGVVSKRSAIFLAIAIVIIIAGWYIRRRGLMHE